MPTNNLISVTLPQEDVNAVLVAITTIKTKLPFLVNLSKEDRQGLSKMGDKSVAFAGKALDYAQKNATLVPPYLDLPEFKKDADLTEALNSIIRELAPLTQSVDDTLMLVGSECLASARTFYQSAKAGAKNNVPGASAIVEDLSARFPGGARAGKNETPK